MANSYGRQVVLTLTNKSGGGVIAGDVVIIDTSNDSAFTTTTAGASMLSVGIAQETIANNVAGRVLVQGEAALINVPASVTRGHYIKTHTVAKQATGSSSRQAGSFGQFTTGGTTPKGWLWSFPDNAGAAGETVATSAIWTAKGQIAAATGTAAASALTVGANGLALVADSAQSTGLKYGFTRYKAVRAKEASAQSVTNTGTNILLDPINDADVYDSDALHDTSSNTSRLTCDVAGVWSVGGQIAFAANATGYRTLVVRHTALSGGATTNIAVARHDNAGAAVSTILNAGGDYLCAAGDWFELLAGHTGSGALNVTTDGFWMHYVGPA